MKLFKSFRIFGHIIEVNIEPVKTDCFIEYKVDTTAVDHLDSMLKEIQKINPKVRNGIGLSMSPISKNASEYAEDAVAYSQYAKFNIPPLSDVLIDPISNIDKFDAEHRQVADHFKEVNADVPFMSPYAAYKLANGIPEDGKVHFMAGRGNGMTSCGQWLHKVSDFTTLSCKVNCEECIKAVSVNYTGSEDPQLYKDLDPTQFDHE